MSLAAPQFHRLTISDIRRETPDSVSLAFAIPASLGEAYRFAPGQHITLKRVIGGEEVRRSYSICSGLDEGELRVAVKKQEGGVFSGFAQEGFKPGDHIEVMTPSGHFTAPLDHAAARTYLGIAAGSGITPLLSIIKTVLAREPKSRFFLLYGNRTTQSIMFRAALEELKDRFLDRFSVTHVLSREAQDVPVLSGRIDAEKIALFLRGIGPVRRDRPRLRLRAPGAARHRRARARGAGTAALAPSSRALHRRRHADAAAGDGRSGRARRAPSSPRPRRCSTASATTFPSPPARR